MKRQYTAFPTEHFEDCLMRNSHRSIQISEKQSKIYNALTVASIVSNSAGVDTSRSAWLSVDTVKEFMESQQMQSVSEQDVTNIIQSFEPDNVMRGKNCLSFEGFACFLMDQSNFAFVNEANSYEEQDMAYPLSYYYIASSHNTYLTGHQLKGESSVELYRQVLLSGCRCVELDCWDGDDGYPVIYHGHTFTTKIDFLQVVKIIDRSAFETSCLPVIISIENHCCLAQQTRMAAAFKSIWGEKLVSKFLFDADFSDLSVLPSPLQLKNKILIKNKKIICEPPLLLSDRAVPKVTDIHVFI
ncbi:unnamed protein product [Soboliphyme baturini]|uniref:Phosphoinositide phospholipase C n=1 Tax=Soboliphyme baturini TaxID=241478 RepID=A0A183J123_9BILA|nr:unnamed protein product [Soboliphyme baturini]